MILVKVIFNKIFTAEILKKTLKTNSKWLLSILDSSMMKEMKNKKIEYLSLISLYRIVNGLLLT